MEFEKKKTKLVTMVELIKMLNRTEAELEVEKIKILSKMVIILN